MAGSVDALLTPRSVAVLGASSDPLKRGYQAIARLQADGFEHPIYPVNPTADEILGLRAYPDVEAIDGPVDLALVVTPAALVPGLLQACGRKGVRAAVVIAVGFGETGVEGRALEQEIAAIAAANDIVLVGPNTNGVFNLDQRLNLVGVADVPQGEVALVSQSGNLALSLFTEAAAHDGLGFSSYVGIGNEAGLRYHELLRHLADDPCTRALLLYVEGFRDGRSLLAAAAEVGSEMPVVAYKAGRSVAARRSVRSHTGAIAGRPELADALLRQAGVVVVARSDELLAVCETLVAQPPPPTGAVAILADGGGHATVAADALDRHGLVLAELTEATRDRLAQLLPAAAATGNPVDVAGATDRDPALFAHCAEVLYDDPGVGGVLCVGLFGGYGIRFNPELAAAEDEAAVAMAAAARQRRKPLLVQSAYAHARPPAHQLLREAGVAVQSSVETAVACLAALEQRRRWLATADRRRELTVAPRTETSARVLSEPAGRELLARGGLDLGPWRLAADPPAAAAAAQHLGGPVAMKVVSPDVVHKSDVGGVILDVEGAAEAADAFTTITDRITAEVPAARIDGVLVTPMAPRGVELIIGATTEATFGPVLTVGAGGVAVEILGDATFRAIPVTAAECHDMLDELLVTPLLDGFRGAAAVDRGALVSLLLAVSELVASTPEVAELDLNPVIVHHGGLAAVDVRVVASDAAVDATAITEPGSTRPRGEELEADTS